MICRLRTIAVFVLLVLNSNVFANSIIAIVNDDIITWNSIISKVKPESTKEEKLDLVNTEVDLALQIQKINEMGLGPTSASLESTLKNVANNNNLTFDQLQSLPQYDEIVKEVTKKLSLRNLKDFALKDIDTNPTQDAIDIELLLNPSPNILEKQVKLSQIVVSTLDTTENPGSTDEMLIKFLSGLIDKIDKGASFSDLAKLHSQDQSYNTGGLSGWLIFDKLPQLFKDTLKSLSNNQISKPFSTGKDWRIIKISDERSIDPHLIKIQKQLEQSNIDKYYSNWVRDLRRDAYIAIFKEKL